MLQTAFRPSCQHSSNRVSGISTRTMYQSATPSLSQTIWPRWASRQFLTLPIVQTLLTVTFGYSLSSEAVVMRQFRRWKSLWRRSLTRSHKRTSMGPSRIVGTVQQVHCSRRRLHRRGLEFHVCTINKSAHTKKSLETFLMILVYIYIIIIIKSCRQHGYPWPSLATSLYHSSPLAGLWLHPASSNNCCMYVRAGRPVFAWPYAGVHRSTSLMSSFLLLQQCPACLVRLTCIVFVMGGNWSYSWCLVGCWRQNLFNIALNILV